MLASGDADGTVRLWDVTDRAHPRLVGQPLIGDRGVPVGSVAFSPGGHVLASGDADGTARLWDVTDPAQPRPFGPILTGGVGAVFNSEAFVTSVALDSRCAHAGPG